MKMRILLSLTLCLTSSLALAEPKNAVATIDAVNNALAEPLPTEQGTPAAAPAPASETAPVAIPATPTPPPNNLSDAAGNALDKLATKASELTNAVLPNGLPLPPELGGGMAPVAPENVDPSFSQGQDKSVTVTSGGKPASLFFTPNQLASIMRAKEGYLAPREAFDPNNQSDNPNSVGSRVVSLAGIIYVSKKDWVIWLNGERVTSKNMPQRLVGVTVKPDRVHLRWMDIANQRIVNITLQPHQQYLLDSDTIIPAG